MTQLALVGCAHIHTPGFVNKLKEREDLKVKSVWDPNPVRAEKRAAELGAAVVADVKEIWRDKSIAGAVICSETNRHLDLVLAGARAKKHLFVEKPLGMASRDGYKMAAAIEKAGVTFQTGYFMRGLPVHLYLKQLIDAGGFGKITRARGSNCHEGALGGWFDARPENPADDWRWMADPAVSGVGAFGDLGTHALDILLWLLGDVTSATGTVDVGTNRYAGCDETGEGQMRFANGAIVTLAAGWLDRANPVTLEISGTDAHAVVINGHLYLRSEKIEGADGKTPFTSLPEAAPAGFDAFLNAVAGRSDAALVSAREAAYRSAVMEAMYEGARKNKWVAPKPAPGAKLATAGQPAAVEQEEGSLKVHGDPVAEGSDIPGSA